MSPIIVRCKPWWRPVIKTCGRTQKVCAGTRSCACMCMKEMFFVRCVYMHTHMRETLPCVCARTHVCRRERNAFCWVQNIYLQHFCKVYLHQGGEWVVVQLVEAMHCKKKLPWCICSKHDNNPQIRVTFEVPGFIVRWKENMHTTCTEKKQYKTSVHTANVLCIVTVFIVWEYKQGIMALCATCNFLLLWHLKE